MVSTYSAEFDTLGADQETLSAALGLAVQHQLQFWDSLICATAVRAGCTLLLSEDMQDGFAWRGLTIANPFAAALHAMFRALSG
ncbi:MAG TPA: hypothetical protein VGS12_06785 [Caulobacteraceae bacterium]|nr:hypothetical protein [Caulobacteraceae bacterium]